MDLNGPLLYLHHVYNSRTWLGVLILRDEIGQPLRILFGRATFR
jgi:hypothetical protein